MVRRIYDRPPIKEAVCEVRVFRSGPWDPTFPGRLATLLEDEYPAPAREREVIQAGVMHNAENQEVHFAEQRDRRIELLDESGTRLVSIGADLISISDIGPYDGWETYQPRIERALTAFGNLVKPEGVVRFGLRYINQIQLPANWHASSRLEDYFTILRTDPPDSDLAMTALTSRVVWEYPDEVRLALVLASVEDEDGESSGRDFVLDIDVSQRLPEEAPQDFGTSMGVIEMLHEREGGAFEASITDRTRELFQ